MVELISIFILGGLFSGFTAGLFGIGGGSFLIPLFLYLLPKIGASPTQTMHQAVATSLAIIIPSTLSASYKQYRLKNIDFSVVKSWVPFVSIGLLAAILSFEHISSTLLQTIFVLYLLSCALYMFFESPSPESQHTIKIPLISYALVGLLVGVLSTLLGVGGGTMTTPYFTLYRYPLKKAIAISSVTGIFIGLLGTLFMIFSSLNQTGLARFSLGYVNILSVVILTPFCIISANYGVKVSNFVPEKYLKILYAFFLISIATYIYFNNINA